MTERKIKTLRYSIERKLDALGYDIYYRRDNHSYYKGAGPFRYNIKKKAEEKYLYEHWIENRSTLHLVIRILIKRSKL